MALKYIGPISALADRMLITNATYDDLDASDPQIANLIARGLLVDPPKPQSTLPPVEGDAKAPCRAPSPATSGVIKKQGAGK